MSKATEIQNFYQNQKVFITGGTGFLGQVLVEKLLRSTEITSIYFLIRDKKDRSKSERLEEIFQSEFFSKLKEECPSFKSKIIPITGDCSENNLGLSPEDREELVGNVNIVFHMAATIRFDENIKTAYQINFCSTKTIVEMCKEMKKLKVFMYVSTAFSNCYLETINETVYQHPVDPDELGAQLEKLSNSEANDLTPKIIGKFPNTYIFTKAMAEYLIEREISHLPVGIFRPSIVISTYKEPFSGWAFSWGGASQVMASYAAGFLRIMHVDKNVFMNLVPVDKSIAGMIAAVWDISRTNEKKENFSKRTKLLFFSRNSSTVLVYNYVSPPQYGLTHNDFTVLMFEHLADYPLSNAMWIPQFQYVENRFYYLFMRTLLHSLPALLMDLLLIVCFQKPIMWKISRRIDKMLDLLQIFCLTKWTWCNDNVTSLWKKMDDDDKELFPLTMTTVCWPFFLRNFWLGIRLYLLKQKPDTVEKAKRRQKWFQIARLLMKISFYFGLFTLVRYFWFKNFLQSHC